LAQQPKLAVLLGHQLLVERGDLDVEVVRRQVEVGSERLRRLPVAVRLEDERARLVLPRDAVEVEQLRELTLRVVGEADALVGQQLLDQLAYPPVPAARFALGAAAAVSSEGRSSWMAASISSTTPANGTMLSTPWPWRTRSTISSPVRASTEREPLSTRLAEGTSAPR